MLPFEEARTRMLALVAPLGAERVGLEEALGRVLAEDVTSPVDLPGFDQSMMDGYAVQRDALAAQSETRVPVRGEAKAGSPRQTLVPGSVCRVFTGAPLPLGADAVVMQEDVRREGEVAIFAKQPAPSAHVRFRGSDLRAEGVAIPRGTRLRPAHLGLGATAQRAWLTVHRKPTVTIVTTGDELRLPGSWYPRDAEGTDGLLPESNGVAIAAAARQEGCIVRLAPLVPDQDEAVRGALADALRSSDLVITVGGASVGDHDRVKPCLEALGVALDFWKVAIKPGKPLMVGRHGSTLVLGLPGNPAAALVTFALFGVPAIRALQGHATPIPVPRRAKLAGEIRRSPGRLEFGRARLTPGPDGDVLRLLPNQSSGAVTSLAEADALALLPPEAAFLPEGSPVAFYPLSEIGL